MKRVQDLAIGDVVRAIPSTYIKTVPDGALGVVTGPGRRSLHSLMVRWDVDTPRGACEREAYSDEIEHVGDLAQLAYYRSKEGV